MVLITRTKNLDIALKNKNIEQISMIIQSDDIMSELIKSVWTGESKSFFFSGWRCKNGSKWTRRMLILTLKHPIIWISGSRWIFALSCRMFDKMRGTEMKWEPACRLFWKRKIEIQSRYTLFYSKEPAESQGHLGGVGSQDSLNRFN